MLDIYICEDDPKQLAMYTKFISDSIMIEAFDMRIVASVTEPHGILEHLSTAENTGVFFLDIDLKSDFDGLELAQRIRRMQPRCFIVFITSHSEMTLLTFHYKVEALDFILKKSPREIKAGIHGCLLNAQEKYSSLNNNITRTFVISDPDRILTVDYDEILFFETSNNIHKIILHAKKRVLEFGGQLKDVEKQLDDRFYRCHRSYIVNKKNIAEADFENMILYMENGETCPISVRMKKGLKKSLLG